LRLNFSSHNLGILSDAVTFMETFRDRDTVTITVGPLTQMTDFHCSDLLFVAICHDLLCEFDHGASFKLSKGHER
jgi:hypothetical protein